MRKTFEEWGKQLDKMFDDFDKLVPETLPLQPLGEGVDEQETVTEERRPDGTTVKTRTIVRRRTVGAPAKKGGA